jgi:hypothetical protein
MASDNYGFGLALSHGRVWWRLAKNLLILANVILANEMDFPFWFL